MPPSTNTPQTDETADTPVVRRLLSLTWNYKGRAALVLFLQLLVLVAGLAVLKMTGLGIDFIRFTLDPNNPAVKPPLWPLGFVPPPSWTAMQTVWAVGLCILALAAVRGLLQYAYAWNLANLIERKLIVDLRTTVCDKLQRLSFRFFDDHASGSIINRVTGDSRMVAIFINNVLIQGVVVVLTLSVFLFYMFSTHTTLTLACLATTPVLVVTAVQFSRKVHPAYLKSRDLSDHLIGVYSECIQGIHVVKGFNLEEEEKKKFTNANRRLMDHQIALFGTVSRFGPTMDFLTQINLVVLLAFGGLLVVRGEFPFGTGLVVFAVLLQQFGAQLNAISSMADNAQQGLVGARRVFEVLDAPIEIRNAPDARDPGRLRGRVTFDHVHFEFDPGQPVLSDVSFTVEPGQCVAILGPTGSGKSVLLSLIPRFYDPTRGRVFLDGCDARSLDLDGLRRNIGKVFPAQGETRYRVGFLAGCIANVSFARLNEATVRVLQANGCEVAVPAGQTCCGALHVHSGLREEARRLARRNIDAFLQGGFDAIITNAAGCGSTLKEYGELLEDDPAYAQKAARFSALTKDVTEFLASIELNRNMGPVEAVVTYQDSCHLAHGQKIRVPPRRLLQYVPGLIFREMPVADLCCGSAGVYNVAHNDMAMSILKKKMNSIRSTGATVIATANPGCLLQLEAGARLFGEGQRVMHVIEILDAAYQNAERG